MKKVGLCSLALASVLTLSGCKGTTNDVEKQIEKMEDVVKEGKIFEKDYSYTTSMSNDGEELDVKMIRDNNKMYVEVEADLSEFFSGKMQLWIEEVDKEYTIYMNFDGEKKYSVYDEDEYEEFEEGFNLLGTTLKDSYESHIDALEDAIDECDEEGVTCEIEKTLLGKVTFNYKDEDGKATYVLKGGKILSVEVKATSEIIPGVKSTTKGSMECEYKNQTVEMPDKDDYEKTKDLFDQSI